MPILSLISSIITSGNATKAQEQAAQTAASTQMNMFNKTQQNLQPFIGAGASSMNNLMALLGLGGEGPLASGATGPGGELTYNLPAGFNIPAGDALAIGANGNAGYIDPETKKITSLPGVANFATTPTGGPGSLPGPGGQGGTASILQSLQNTPGYQFTLNQGLQSLINQRTATGGVGGANSLQALMGYGSGLADSTYQQSVGNAYNLASLSENAAAGLGSQSAQVGSSIAGDILQGGNAASAGQAAIGNAISGFGNSLSSNFLLYSLLNSGGGAGAAAALA